MSYYDALYPTYNTTRLQIQKTILSLQDKLNKRKQLDLLLEKDIYQQQLLKQKQRQLNTYHVSRIHADNLLRQSITKNRIYQQSLGYGTYDQLLHKQAIQRDYLTRINGLRRQKSLLNKQFAPQTLDTNSPIKNKIYQLDSDQLLVKKYQDGTKINEYNKQLQASNEKRFSQTDGFISSKKDNQYQSNKARMNKLEQNFETPFDKLRMNETASNKSQAGTSQIKYSNSKKKLYNEQISSKTTKIVQQYSRAQSPGKPHHSPTKSSLSKSKLPSQVKQKSILNRSRAQFTQQNALKKIQNRLALSSIIYEDSNYRNNKHQTMHLYATYQNQIRIRKDVRDKINNHPNILRKHAMVVGA